MITKQNLQQIRKLEATLQEHMELFGYELIDLPTIEDAEIFLTKAGNTIIEQLFTFQRFGRLLALRPEFTAAVAYRYTQEKHTSAVRWQLSGSIFVDEPSDYSLQYEQHNIGAELIGQNGNATDAEIVAMAAQGMDKIGIPDWQLIIGHVGLQLHLLSQFKLDNRTYRILLSQRDRLKEQGKQAVLDYLNEILTVDDIEPESHSGNGQETQHMLDVLLDSTRYGTTMGGRSRHDIAARLLKKHDRSLERAQIHEALDFLDKWSKIRGTTSEVKAKIQSFIADDDAYGQKLFADWFDMLDLLDAYGISEDKIILQPDLTKNWDYYTGIVFGIRANDSYVASGGRYDDLTQLLGGDDAFPAVGFAYYTQKLIDALPPENIANTLTLTCDDPQYAIQWATLLRQNNIGVEIRADECDIVIDGDQASYNDKTYTRDELVQELTQ